MNASAPTLALYIVATTMTGTETDTITCNEKHHYEVDIRDGRGLQWLPGWVPHYFDTRARAQKAASFQRYALKSSETAEPRVYLFRVERTLQGICRWLNRYESPTLNIADAAVWPS